MTTKVQSDNFGRDHWSLLVYCETRVVDYGGRIDPAHLRRDGKENPTRLTKGKEVANHGDWDCLKDLQSAGFLSMCGHSIVLTKSGWNKAHKLRRERAQLDR